VASAGLLHLQVDVDFEAVEDKISHCKYQPDANDQPQSLHTVKAIISQLSEVWPEPPPDGHLHVFITLPDLPDEDDTPEVSSELFFSPST
jgi:hypothetical protein